MLIKHRGFEPAIEATAFIAPNAVVAGRVQIKARTRVMYGAVIDAEGARVEIGECSIICENAVVRASAAGEAAHPVFIGNHVFVSPHATLLGCRIESCSYIATQATVLQGASIASGAVVAVGAFVHANASIPADFFVPPYSIAVGDPVKLYSPHERDALTAAIKSIGFAKVAFGVEASWEDRLERYKQATEVRSAEFGGHFEDTVLPPE